MTQCTLTIYCNKDVNRLTIEHNAQTAQSSASKPSDIVEIGLPLHDARILVLSVSPDQTASYVPIMNSIFSAQKLVSS